MLEMVRDTLERSCYGAPALPFPVLVTRLRAQGAAVTESVLLRRLAAPDSGIRVVDPWQGRNGHLRPYVEAVGTPAVSALPSHWVALTESSGTGDPEEPVVRSLRRSLRRLTAVLDDGSPTEVARWAALLEEARRLPRPA